MSDAIDFNTLFLDDRFARLRRLLDAETAEDDRAAACAAESLFDAALRESPAAAGAIPLLRLARVLNLSAFELDLLQLAVAPEIDSAWGRRIAAAQERDSSWPTVSLAWRLFCPGRAAWLESRDALRPDAPLFRFELLTLDDPRLPLPDRTVRADSRAADAILGGRLPDSRLAGRWRYREPGRQGNELSGRMARLRGPFLVHLHGVPTADLENFAAESLAHRGLPLLAADVTDFDAAQAVALVREGLLAQAALLLSGLDAVDASWLRLLRDAGALAFLASPARRPRPHDWPADQWLTWEVTRPSRTRRETLWRDAAGAPAPPDIVRFPLSATQIVDATRTARELASARSPTATAEHVPLAREDLKAACVELTRQRMGELAQPLRGGFDWTDIVLPDEAVAKLRELCGQVRHQERVLGELGFRAKLPRGRGVSALFAGPSGTGKTMAAEIVAADLGLALYRVDLARVVSKYVGETEKNLRAIFQEAEEARCAVLFDEADALFGKRTDVKDSHDRYANLEVSYLLQQVEQVEHAVILLASNRRQAIDEAFLRRFRFVIDFPAPEAAQRERIWRQAFPPQVRVRDVDFAVLAERLVLTGAGIKNIALAATYLAADDGQVVTPALVARAATRELEKLGRPVALTADELTRIRSDA